MHKILEKYVEISEYINDFTDDDLGVIISDKEKILKYVPGEKVNFAISEGDLLKNEGALVKAIKENKKVTISILNEIEKIPMSCTANPIVDNAGSIIGAIATLKNISEKEELKEIIGTLLNSLEEMTKTTSQIASSADKIAISGDEMIVSVNKALEKAKETDQIVKFVKQIATQTNMLGLNASIEAARAGESGRGFQVVAEEIRKLAISSDESVEKISSVLSEIQEVVVQMLNMVEKNGTVTQEQAAGTQEISAEITELSGLADKLDKFSLRL